MSAGPRLMVIPPALFDGRLSCRRSVPLCIDLMKSKARRFAYISVLAGAPTRRYLILCGGCYDGT
jgi:hypothetical protein